LASATQPTKSIDEADSVWIDLPPLCRFEHRQSDEVIDDGEHRQFLVNAVEALGAQYVHPQGLLQLPEVRLNFPALRIQRRQVGSMENRDGSEFSRAALGSSVGSGTDEVPHENSLPSLFSPR